MPRFVHRKLSIEEFINFCDWADENYQDYDIYKMHNFGYTEVGASLKTWALWENSK